MTFFIHKSGVSKMFFMKKLIILFKQNIILIKSFKNYFQITIIY